MGNATFLYRSAKDGTIESKVFDSDALPGGDWVDSPAKCVPAKETEVDISQEFTREELIAEAERRMITVDGRWGIPKLKEVLGLGD